MIGLGACLAAVLLGYLYVSKRTYKQNILDDISRLNPTYAHAVFYPSTPTEISQLIQSAVQQRLHIVPRGQCHSMGGQSLIANGIAVQMDHMKRIQKVCTTAPVPYVWTESGTTWSDLIYHLNKYSYSPQILQSYSSFSVGGSISVNIHGITSDYCLSNSILELDLFDTKGNIIRCSRSQNEDLFSMAIGGYGLFGLILNAKIKIVPNYLIEMDPVIVQKPRAFSQTYHDLCTNKEIKMARIDISTFKTISLYTFSRTNPDPVKSTLNPTASEMSIPSQIMYKWIMPLESAQKIRFKTEAATGKPLDMGSKSTTRNAFLYESAKPLAQLYSPIIDLKQTHILQEYFIPDKYVVLWMKYLYQIFIKDQLNKLSNIHLLNITIRYVRKDNLTYLPYARDDSFAFVFYYRMDCTTEADADLKLIHDLLVNKCLELNGTFYLPYRLHYSTDQLTQAYPTFDTFCSYKRRFDPHKLFTNSWYEKYGNHNYDNESK